MPDLGEQPTGNGVVNSADQNLDVQGTGEIGFGHKRDQRQGGRSPPFILSADDLQKLLVKSGRVATHWVAFGGTD